MTMLLDTNVVSELMRPSPDPFVGSWAAAYPLEELFFSAVGEAELRYGAAILPAGRRRDTLVLDIERMLRHGLRRPGVAIRERGSPHLCRARRHASRHGPPIRTGGLPDRGDRARPRTGRGDPQCSGFRGYGDRGRRSVGHSVRSTTAAFARVQVGAQKSDAARSLTDRVGVFCKHAPHIGAEADNVLGDRSGPSSGGDQGQTGRASTPSRHRNQGRRYAEQLNIPFVVLSHGNDVRVIDRETSVHACKIAGFPSQPQRCP